jgi:glycogen operon protein
MTTKIYETSVGSPHPLGATPDESGVNFSVFSENASAVELLLFSEHDDKAPMQIIKLDPVNNHSFNFWHVFVKGLKAGAHYAYRVDGPPDKSDGHRFNKNKVLIDPYARGNTDALWNRMDACGDQCNLETSMRSVVIELDQYDWEGDKPLNRSMKDTIIYEMHIGGFTRDKSANVQHPGTFAAVIEKIPYLQALGITAVELLPVFEFDNKEILRITDDGTVIKNYWGYSTVGFFAPESSYCVNPKMGTHLNEFRDMVKALHKAGIEVILDVVFNHTNEGNHQGPTISFKGFDNSMYYYLVPHDKQYYMDYSGCGNTINCNHPIAEKFILDCLVFWVREMHVDGFRFDEGSILSRGENGVPLEYPPVLWSIELSETLADTKMIAEAWDAGGLYEVGKFPGYRWAEWNGRYRDDIRSFVRGDAGLVGAVASRIAGSADVYQQPWNKPVNSINFIACHDGFTMMDLVSYNYKHNEANGEGNQDGINDNLSSNYGVEGATSDATLSMFRQRQLKNFIAILMLSQGVPMLLAGDEAGRTQKGNNNAYCQDNEISWFNWQDTKNNKILLQFAKNMIAFRNENSLLRRGRFFDGSINQRGIPDVSWHGCKLNAPGWNDAASRVLAFTLGSFCEGEPDLHVILNMAGEALDFELPELPAGLTWYRAIDTSLPAPQDILAKGKENLAPKGLYRAEYFSVVVLIAK